MKEQRENEKHIQAYKIKAYKSKAEVTAKRKRRQREQVSKHNMETKRK